MGDAKEAYTEILKVHEISWAALLVALLNEDIDEVLMYSGR